MARKQKDTAKVISSCGIAPCIYELWLETELAKEAKPGQFIALYPRSAATLLPRPISICEVSDDKTQIRVVFRTVGEGTRDLAELQDNDFVEVLGVLGNGYPLEEAKGKTVFLMGGGIGIPPILELAKNLTDCEKIIVLGYRDMSLFLKEDLEQYGDVYYATENGCLGVKGNVMDVIEEYKLNADLIYSCGPMPMLRAIKRYAREKNIPAYISLEERMACGIGACLGCVCNTTYKDHHSYVNNARICTEGPVFNAEDVAILPEDEQIDAFKEDAEAGEV